MRARIHHSVEWRAERASLSLWTQVAARMVAIGFSLWAIVTLALVWFWTGYYGGPTAHRYFGDWVLTWFFSDVIPFPFGSVPYRGKRYTIDSMYSFLCYKYHLGGSFPGWFWHYSWWGLFVTLLIMAAVTVILLRLQRDPCEDRYLRGADVTSTRRLGHALSGDGIEVGGVRIPHALEPQHFLFVGAPGSGKSTAIRRMLRQIEARGETAVVLDAEREYVPEFYRPERATSSSTRLTPAVRRGRRGGSCGAGARRWRPRRSPRRSSPTRPILLARAAPTSSSASRHAR